MRPARVLVVDDSAEFRIALCDFLTHLPEVTVVAVGGDGHEALQLVKAAKPDILILDLQILESEDMELLRQLHGLDTSPRLLVLSAYPESDDRQQTLAVGADACAVKGDMEVFTTALHQLISALPSH
jgi:DNA-binding NarL/FixJ family response regulator